MNDATSGTQADDEALDAERRALASDVEPNEDDLDLRTDISDGDMPDELERSAMGGSERIGGTR